MNVPALTKEQIEQAKRLKEQGKTKRELALIFGVGSTTIWDNVYRAEFIPKTGERCVSCTIILEQSVTIRDNQSSIPHNFKLGNKCIACILYDRNIKWEDMKQFGIKITT